MTALDGVTWPAVPFPLKRHLILVGRRGSEAHGTYIPSSDPTSIDDRDLFGVIVPPREYIMGLRTWEHAEGIHGVWDVVLDEVRKFCRMLCAQNPNVLQCLYLEEEDYLLLKPAGRLLIEHRDLFRSRDHAMRAFCGYAHGQLRKMTSIGAYKGDMGQKRKKLVDQFGFDVKNAGHLLRLLYVGEEYLRTGTMRVRRSAHETDWLKQIKRGEVGLPVIQMAADKAFMKVYEAAAKSPLPQSVDHEAIDALVIRIIKTAWEGYP